MSKFYGDIRSQGLPVGKDTLHQYLGHLEDAFLVRLVRMHSASERQRTLSPRKVYPIDMGLIPVYERAGRENRGRSLETAVMLELERRGYEVGWVRVGESLEVDFYAERPGDPPLLIQVSLDTSGDDTCEREIRSLAAAAAAYPEARPMIVTLDPTPPTRAPPAPLEWRAAAHWLLEDATF